MKIKSIIFLLIVIVAMPLSGWSQGVDKEFESRLSESSSQNKTITSRFSQIKKVQGLKHEVSQSGDFYYDNVGRMAMIYDEPRGDKVVMNGEKFTIIAGGKRIESSASNPMMAQISYMMQASMSGDVGKLGRGWELKISLDNGEYKAVVVPIERRIKRYVASMTMAFDSVTMTLNSLKIDETKGGYTLYSFTSKQINKAIDPEIFIP